ncbi:helix-turn-helix domain-containing protein [Rikenella microfusus]|uniref:Anaerobic benzoate catabolism transcriptional regulator n=1 Tax=Rikenella microfusus TaxID=28139 RepID=A0A379MUN8_9BACT|nr:helix-turn-helix transcriptional regulator [Rikenella microfusus]SUE34600.1 anaerobic benzoate catabolism transcriptional regulator [Rikenella microfusus]HJE88839.1 helix-turn-helix domain-containing protein [Rikenella microfusus]
MNDILYRIGRRIVQIRTERGISQQDLAARCNFEKSNMSRIEYGRTNMTLVTLLTISRALGVKLRDLVDVE